jgi:FkbM family methyltransferase
MRNRIRALLPPVISRLPDLRGRGRMTLFFDRFLTDSSDPRSYETIGTLNRGVRFHFDLRPWGQKFAYYYRAWEQDYISTLRSLYRGGWFIDVGSSLGLYVVCMAETVRSHGGRIASIEPVPFNRERQQVNVNLNGAEDVVELADVALGSGPAVVRLKVDPEHADNNAFINEEGDVEVEVVAFDTLCEQRGWRPIGAMKIDVEGYEPMVIDGARKTIARDRPTILAEFNRERMAINGFSIEPSWQFLQTLGYQAYVLAQGRMLPIREPALHENMFFVPAEVKIPA